VQLAFIQDLLTAVINETLVEPRRGVISLDYDMRVEEVGPPAPPVPRAAGASGPAAAAAAASCSCCRNAAPI
jgi:hypothetical protein